MLDIGGVLIDPDMQLDDLDRADCAGSLSTFIEHAWHAVEPGTKYVHGWHIDFICYHLEAISNGVMLDDDTYYNRVLINIPPGAMKSLILNVFWPAWEWGPRGMPNLRYICAAHKIENLSARDSRRMRQLITSEWYQRLWGDIVCLKSDQNEKLNFENTAGGFRIATAITGLTGMRGDRVIIDDPHSVDSAFSDVQRESEVNTFLTAVPTRTNDPIKSAIVVIMQRLHEEDVSGVILEKPELGYDHIMLPMWFDQTRAAPTKLGYVDPRETEGDLLFPERFPESVVNRDAASLGEYGTAGQFQQSPVPIGGGIIKRDWWLTWESEDNQFPPFDYIIGYLDTAYTEKTINDYSAMIVWGVFTINTIATPSRVIGMDGKTFYRGRTYNDGSPKVMMMYAWQKRLQLHGKNYVDGRPLSNKLDDDNDGLVEKVAKVAKAFKIDKLLIENKAAGISVAQELARLYGYEKFSVQLDDPKSQDKTARLYSVQHLFQEGMVYAPDKEWVETVITQVGQFPTGKHDDLVDCVSGGIRHLREIGLLTRAPEHRQEVEESMRTIRQNEAVPLYPA